MLITLWKSCRKKTVYVICSFLILMQPAMSAALEEVTFSGGAPLNEYQPSIIMPLLTEAFKRNGIGFQAKYHPSLRSLLYSNAGKMDGELHRVYDFHDVSNGRYPNLMRIESHLLSVWLAAFTTRKIKIETWRDLQGYKVAYYRGRKNVEARLGGTLPPESILDTTTDKEAFRLLARGMADIVISESRQGKKLIADNAQFGSIAEVAKMGETRIYAYLHKKHAKLAPRIAATLEKMKADGTFENRWRCK